MPLQGEDSGSCIRCERYDDGSGSISSMELLPIGPVVMIDTPGIDDEGELGQTAGEKKLPDA